MKLKNHPGSAKKTMREDPGDEDDYPVDEEINGSSFLAGASSELDQSLSSGLIEGTQHISYHENMTDGDEADSAELGANETEEKKVESAAAGGDESSDCDVDEHAAEPEGEGLAESASPPKMNPTQRLNVARNLSAVLEEKSCHLSSGQVSVDQQFMSPDLIMRKQRREQNSKAAKGKKAPAFKQPAGKGKPKVPGFSLNLMQAVQELKESEVEGEVQDLPSEVNRRIKHHKVANEAEAQLRRLQELKLEQNELMQPSESISYQEDSSQFQSFANSPEMRRKPLAEPVLTNISPVKVDPEDLEIVKDESQQPSIADTAVENTRKTTSAELTPNQRDEDDEEASVGGIRFVMYSPEESEQESRVPNRRPSRKLTQQEQEAHDANLVDSMKNFLTRKKLDFTQNVTGFFEKLNETESKLKESQDKLEKKIEGQQRADALKIEFESQMTEAIYAINDINRQESISRSSGGQTTTTRDSDSDHDNSFSSSTKKKEFIKKAKEAKKAYEEITFKVQAEQEAQNPRLFSSVVNHISEVDLAGENPNQLDGEHFLVTVEDVAAAAETSNQKEVNQSFVSSSDSVKSPPKKPIMHIGRKKFVKRLVKKQDPAKQAQAKLAENQAERETQKMQQAMQDFKKEIAGFFDIW